MPELPEVETTICDLIQNGVVGKTILSVLIKNDNSLQNLTSGSFSIVNDQKIISISRRGKFIIFKLSTVYLLVHLRMTGKFILKPSDASIDKHEHVVFMLDGNQSLRFHDTRKFGRIYLTEAPQKILNRLGVEPLSVEFTPNKLESILHSHSRMIKPLILDQNIIAGIGNIYADEALWFAKINPLMKSDKISIEKINALHEAIQIVLKKGIRNAGTTLGNGVGNFNSIGKRGHNQEQLFIFNKTNHPCPRCGHSISKIIVSQRGTHLCEKCQK